MAAAATYDVLIIQVGTTTSNIVTAINTAVAAHDVTAFVRDITYDPTRKQFVVLIEKPPVP